MRGNYIMDFEPFYCDIKYLVTEFSEFKENISENPSV